ncbi:hypothetical protein Xsto_01135 [Xenorhabdus stockiae]|uniref:ParB/Sulfiredoxin domain-containing protein n=1 Tax=Xenorhabdus stockiae TaxID=351614 RepID=A0A2D0KSX1_9GAMM|nr:transcriptional regulator [Xenorhabdus stockiae]PHM66523.1 hypothetical protein Xsto_01135 [Xenorhabdus stockiae]
MKQRIVSGESYHIGFELVKNLVQSEEVDAIMVERLQRKISLEGIWKSIIPIEYKSNWVMDGNHRLNVAYGLGLLFIPVVRLKYSDHRVKVYDWKDNKPYCINNITREIENKKILPYKTTRHFFNPSLPDVNFALDTLCDRKVWSQIKSVDDCV